MTTEIRCPDDDKLFFTQITDCLGCVQIKCRGRCHRLWEVTWLNGKAILRPLEYAGKKPG